MLNALTKLHQRLNNINAGGAIAGATTSCAAGRVVDALPQTLGPRVSRHTKRSCPIRSGASALEREGP